MDDRNDKLKQRDLGTVFHNFSQFDGGTPVPDSFFDCSNRAGNSPSAAVIQIGRNAKSRLSGGSDNIYCSLFKV